MPRKAGTSPKAEHDRLRDRMRALGCTVPQIAAEMSRRFTLRPRLAWRYALGWPQWKLAQAYNTAHPGATLSDSRISEYERWPHGGSLPSPRYLTRLAVAFGHGCTPAHLVDADDLEHFEPADRYLLTQAPPGPALAVPISDRVQPGRTNGHRSTQVITLPVGQPGTGLVLPTDPAVGAATIGLQLPGDLAPLVMIFLEALTTSDGDVLTTARGQDHAYHRFVRSLTDWAHTMKRRLMLRSLGWAVTAASAGYSLNLDEQSRVAAVFSNPSRLDTQTIKHFEMILSSCKRQDDTLGPRWVLETVLIQRNLLHSLLPDCPDALRSRLLSVLSIASGHAGWFSFNLNDVTSAACYYEDARVQAHAAGNTALGAKALDFMSGLATCQDKPRMGIDHAVAAQQWASRSDDMRLRALCADGAALAYAADGQRNACLAALDTAATALSRVGDQAPGYVPYIEEVHLSKRAKCHLELGDADRATDYAQQSLATMDPGFPRRVALTSVDLSRAYARSDEVEEAARLLGNAGEIAAHNSSTRLTTRVQQGRAELQLWKDAQAIRELDDRLTTYGLA